MSNASPKGYSACKIFGYWVKETFPSLRSRTQSAKPFFWATPDAFIDMSVPPPYRVVSASVDQTKSDSPRSAGTRILATMHASSSVGRVYPKFHKSRRGLRVIPEQFLDRNLLDFIKC